MAVAIPPQAARKRLLKKKRQDETILINNHHLAELLDDYELPDHFLQLLGLKYEKPKPKPHGSGLNGNKKGNKD